MTTVITGGTILIDADLDGSPVSTHAIAFRDGRVAAHGAEAEALASAAGARTLDLAGGVLAPGLGDGHCHPILGALEANGPAVRAAATVEEIVEAVRVWKEAHPDDEWIIGGSYDATFTPGGIFDAHWLDEVTGDTPTILRAWDYHTAWVNSAALAAGGITAETPDPELGRIVRREDGSPIGTLQEAAANDFLANIVPVRGLAVRVDAIERATREFAEIGITWIQDAWVEGSDVAVYLDAAAQNRLHTRVNLAFRADPLTWREQVAQFLADRERVIALGHERLTAQTVKFFLDGVIEGHTAALLEPYADRPDDSGLPNWTDAELQAATAAFDAAGFQLHLHAIGDAANRSALDAFEAIRDSGVDPERARHHVVAHVAMLAPEDVARFAELDVIANFEPYWAKCDSVMENLTIPHIGQDRDDRQYLIGSLVRSGATISFGSDWPVTTLDWREAFSTAILRNSHLTPDEPAWLPNEVVNAGTALAAYTKGIARQALAPERGTLAVGSPADAVWLSGNPLEVAAHEVPDLAVRVTWIAGEPTYTA
ncbi:MULTISPECIES: amidohydrolase [unclassified Leucobacter]|uniref:amidohydrolase n=1 Tax=unclassified Leucobacter TaxID=2621730 RepID=UPI00165D56AF|nr:MULTISPECIES: amidohydrolase [unclassified Leucobacter]MBC9928468.1 amidohydrolase [Leucobacter sp. cx-169]